MQLGITASFLYVIITGTMLIKLGPYCLQRQLFVLPQRKQEVLWLCLTILPEQFYCGHLHLEHSSWEPSCYSPGGSEIQIAFPVWRTRSYIKCIFFCFGLMLLLGSYWCSLQTFYLLRCGEVKILHWAEWSCLLPSWLQFLYIEFCWIPFSGMKGGRDCCNTRVVTACQVLLASQPSWRLESEKPFTGEDDFFFLKATAAPSEYCW